MRASFIGLGLVGRVMLGAGVLWTAAAAGQQAEPAVVCSEAAEPQPIAYGEHSVGCAIGPVGTDLDRLAFTGAAGDVVRAVVLSGTAGLDPRIELRSPVGAVLADSSCNGNGGFQGAAIICSVAVEVTLATSGQHTILISDAGANDQGNYAVQLERLPPVGTPTVLPHDGFLMDEVLPQPDVDCFRMDGTATTSVRLTVRSRTGGFDPRLEVRDPAGTELVDAFCDGNSGFQGAAVQCTLSRDLTLDPTGEYLVCLSDQGSNEAGSYELSLQCLFGTCSRSNRFPAIADIADKAVAVGTPLAFVVTATDPDDNALAITADGLPAGATLTDHGNGTADFSWTPSAAADLVLALRATDDGSPPLADIETVRVVVGTANAAPQLQAISGRTVHVRETLTLNVAATDAEPGALVLSTGPLPAGATFTDHGDRTGTLSWTPDAAQLGPYLIRFVATDGGAPMKSDQEDVSVAVVQPAQLEAGLTCSEAAEPQLMVYGQHTNACAIGSVGVDSDRFQFAGAVDDVVRIVVLSGTAGFDPRVELRSPLGAVISDSSCNGNGGFQGGAIICSVAAEVTLPMDGQYTILISDAGANEAGNYTLQLERLPPLGSLPVLPYNRFVVDDVAPQPDVDCFRVDGLASTGIRLTVRSQTGAFDTRLEVRDPEGTELVDTFCDGNSGFQGAAVQCSFARDLTLDVSGDYLVCLSDQGSNEGGTYELSLQCLFGACPSTPDETALHCDETLAGAVSAPGGSARFVVGFTVDDESIEVSLRPTGGTLSPRWMLRNRDGENITPTFCGGGFAKEGTAACGPLPASGNPYHVEVVDLVGPGTGTFEIHLQRLKAASACEQAPACAIGPAVESDLLRFAPRGATVRVNLIVTSSNFFPRWALLDGSGNNVTPFLCGGGFARDGAADCGPLDPGAGPYRIVVADVQHAHSGTYIVTVDGVSLCCGNQVLDAAEPCDLTVPGGGPQACCTGQCGFVTAGSVCRSSAGACDEAETCTGSSAACPADALASSAVVCRSSAGACDQAETCTGSSPLCPADAFRPSGQVCRTTAGVCDIAEACSGTSPACPPDGFAPTTQVCRGAAGPCDVADVCSGVGPACPADAFRPSGTECRSAAGVCDLPETCAGTSAACPTDAFRPSGTLCRSSAGSCDVAEACSGASASCPADAFLPSTTICRSAAGICDVAEACSGTTAACAPDGFALSGTVCRPASDGCDAPESCSGASPACPADVQKPVVCGDGATCGSEACDPPGESCGGGGACGASCTCEGTCGNGRVDSGETCDASAARSGCPLGATCTDCSACVLCDDCCPTLMAAVRSAYAGSRVRVPVVLDPKAFAVASLNFTAEYPAAFAQNILLTQCSEGEAASSVQAQLSCSEGDPADHVVAVLLNRPTVPVPALPAGVVAEFEFTVPDTARGNFPICLPQADIDFGGPDGFEVCAESSDCGGLDVIPSEICKQGDCNCDGAVNAGDRVCLVSKFFDESLQCSCDCEDCNLSGELNAADAPCITLCAFGQCPVTGTDRAEVDRCAR